MTSVNFNYGINTDEGRAALAEYERMALAEIDKPILYASFHEPTPVIYTFVPKPDITAYELALCVPIMQYGTAHEGQVMELPEFVRRNFVKRGE